MADEKKDETRVEKTPLESLDVKSLFGEPEKESKSPEKTDDTKPSSSEVSEEQDPKELQAKLDAVTKELNRVRKGKAESSAEVQELREQLSNIQGQLEVMSKGASKDEKENFLAKYSDEQLLQGQTEWEDDLYEQRDSMRRARADNDETAYNMASRKAATARNTLNAIRKELLERTKRVSIEQAHAETERNELVSEVAELYDATYESLPDLKDKDSALWQAGNEIYNRHPKLMKQLGPLAEMVAVALAVTENPKLIPGGGTAKVKEARKELLEEINERAEQALIKGKGTSSRKTVPDFNSMPKDQFDALVHKIKMGG